MDDWYTELDVLQNLINKKMGHIDKEIRDKLFSIMTYEGNKVIRASNYY